MAELLRRRSSSWSSLSALPPDPVTLLQEKLAVQRLRGRTGDLTTLDCVSELGHALFEAHRLEEAEPLFREALLGYQAMGTCMEPSDAGGGRCAGGITPAVAEDGTPAPLAAAVTLETLAGAATALVRETEPLLLGAMASLGDLLAELGRHEEAEALLSRALQLRRQTLGDTHPETLASVTALGNLYRVCRRLDEAEGLLRETLAVSQATLGPSHPDTLTDLFNLGHLHLEQGRHAEAEALVGEAWRRERRLHGRDHPQTLHSAFLLGQIAASAGDDATAEPLLREALRGQVAALGEEHPQTAATFHDLGLLLRRRGLLTEASRMLQAAQQGGPAGGRWAGRGMAEAAAEVEEALRTCANPECLSGGSDLLGAMVVCASCAAARWCTRECWLASWLPHKPECLRTVARTEAVAKAVARLEALA